MCDSLCKSIISTSYIIIFDGYGHRQLFMLYLMELSNSNFDVTQRVFISNLPKFQMQLQEQSCEELDLLLHILANNIFIDVITVVILSVNLPLFL